jgi:hypothetical protein
MTVQEIEIEIERTKMVVINPPLDSKKNIRNFKDKICVKCTSCESGIMTPPFHGLIDIDHEPSVYFQCHLCGHIRKVSSQEIKELDYSPMKGVCPTCFNAVDKCRQCDRIMRIGGAVLCDEREHFCSEDCWRESQHPPSCNRILTAEQASDRMEKRKKENEKARKKWEEDEKARRSASFTAP